MDSLRALRRFSYAALAVAFTHLVFGAIVRITGSGMGCGDHWPKCHGQWFPPLDRPDLIIEITHRWIAVALLVAIVALLVAATRAVKRVLAGSVDAARVASVKRIAGYATLLWIAPAILGAITVWLELPPI